MLSYEEIQELLEEQAVENATIKEVSDLAEEYKQEGKDPFDGIKFVYGKAVKDIK